MELGEAIRDRYEVLQKIREGGMGAIYKVRHRLLDELRVVKVMKPDFVASASMRQRFLDEAKTASRFKHPNIASIHDFAMDEQGTAYLVMEFIDGVNLKELLKAQGPPDVKLSLELMRQSLQALHFLHRKNIVHRDVAPDNLMLSQDDEGNPVIKLIDLGIAKALDDNRGLTVAGAFLGKLSYASPEQFGALEPGEKLDGRSDVYSLGIVLYELLTGVRPFQAENPMMLPQQHLLGQVIPIEESDREGRVPEEVRAAVMKALARHRKDRWATAEELARELERLKVLAPGVEERTVALIRQVRAKGPSASSALTVTSGLEEKLNQKLEATDPDATIQPLAPAQASKPQSATPSAVPNEATVTRPTTVQTTPIAPAAPPRAPAASTARVAAAPAAPAPAAPATRREPAPPEPVPASAAPSKKPPMGVLIGVAVAVLAGVLVPIVARRGKQQEPSASAPAADAPKPAVSADTGAAAPVPTAAAPIALAPLTQPGAVPATAAAAPAPPAPRIIEATTGAAAPRTDAPGDAASSKPITISSEDIKISLAPSAAPEPTVAASTISLDVMKEEPAIRQTIDEYAQGESTLDIGLVQRAYPALGSKTAEITKRFSEIQEQDVAIDVAEIKLEGTTGQVKGTERKIVTPKTGDAKTTTRRVTIGVEKREHGWVITSLR